jgi:hypothetical protein
MSHRRRLRAPAFLIAALAALLVGVSPAAAALVTVGSPLTGTFTPTKGGAVVSAGLIKVPEVGAFAASPVSGAIVRWHVRGFQGGPFRLQVLRPNDILEGLGFPTAYTAVGTGSPEVVLDTGTETFNTDLPIQAGDLIGFTNHSESDLIGVAELAGAAFVQFEPPLGDGITASGISTSGKEIGISAEVQPAPTITAVAPATGPSTGATVVTISGTDLEGATAVTFGAAAASSFVVNSESQITAISPAGNPGAAPISVTTVAGTATSTQPFGFTESAPTSAPTPMPAPTMPAPARAACKVPNLSGRNLQVAKKRLKTADCKIGTVSKRRGATAAKGRVRQQSPKAGKLLAVGAKVKVTLAP